MTKLKLIGLLGLIIIIACQTSFEPIKIQKKYYVTLIYEVKDLVDKYGNFTDPEVFGVEIRTATYFPEQNITNLRTHTFQSWELKNGIYIKVDSAYIGVERQMAVMVLKKPYPPPYDYRTNWRVYIMPRDTLKAFEDSVMTFHWPEDTLRAIERFWYIPMSLNNN